jgi:hypothetical protein
MCHGIYAGAPLVMLQKYARMTTFHKPRGSAVRYNASNFLD